MSKAKQFLEAAETVEALADDSNDVADAYVTLCVHAGIAAADVICCKRLGEHSRGEDHTAAVALARGGLQRWLVWPVVRGPVGRLRVVRGGPPRGQIGCRRRPAPGVMYRPWQESDLRHTV